MEYRKALEDMKTPTKVCSAFRAPTLDPDKPDPFASGNPSKEYSVSTFDEFGNMLTMLADASVMAGIAHNKLKEVHKEHAANVQAAFQCHDELSTQARMGLRLIHNRLGQDSQGDWAGATIWEAVDMLNS